MQDNAGLYREFIDVHEGGGLRRNPKRKNAGGYSAGSYSSYDRPVPTEAQVTAAFDAYVARMRVNGTYGDNLEVNAFTNAYGVNVKIWHYNGCAWLSHPEKVLEETRTVHIALHVSHLVPLLPCLPSTLLPFPLFPDSIGRAPRQWPTGRPAGGSTRT
jgi:hypothetical protein